MSQLQIFAPQQNWRKQVVDRLGAGTAALDTTATDGFAYVPSCAGPPTGTPIVKAGLLPIVIDSTNHKLYFFSGSWIQA